MVATRDHAYYCERFAEILQSLLASDEYFHYEANVQTKNTARALLTQYEAFEASLVCKPSLKKAVERAITDAIIDGKDSTAAILQTIASRAEDVQYHLQDDTRIYEDIRDWLLYEAGLMDGE